MDVRVRVFVILSLNTGNKSIEYYGVCSLAIITHNIPSITCSSILSALLQDSMYGVALVLFFKMY